MVEGGFSTEGMPSDARYDIDALRNNIFKLKRFLNGKALLNPNSPEFLSFVVNNFSCTIYLGYGIIHRVP